ncbi:Hypothetical predicted protein, partial [Paramuricea clavata]
MDRVYCFSMQNESRETSAAQKYLRVTKKITKHAKGNAHVTATNILKERQKRKIQSSTACLLHNINQLLKNASCSTAYYVAKENRPYSDYENLVKLQQKNGISLGVTLHSRWLCTEMIDIIATTMRKKKLIKEITKNNKKIAIIIDEATSNAKDSCLWLYSQKSNGIKDKYLAKNFIAFTSGASIMTGAIKGVATLLKSKYPQIVLWHYLNHRLELAVSDTITAVDGAQHIEDFF